MSPPPLLLAFASSLLSHNNKRFRFSGAAAAPCPSVSSGGARTPPCGCFYAAPRPAPPPPSHDHAGRPQRIPRRARLDLTYFQCTYKHPPSSPQTLSSLSLHRLAARPTEDDDGSPRPGCRCGVRCRITLRIRRKQQEPSLSSDNIHPPQCIHPPPHPLPMSPPGTSSLATSAHRSTTLPSVPPLHFPALPN